MEKFMLIFHGGIKQDASPQDLQSNMGKWMLLVEKLQKEGKYVSGEPPLHAVHYFQKALFLTRSLPEKQLLQEKVKSCADDFSSFSLL